MKPLSSAVLLLALLPAFLPLRAGAQQPDPRNLVIMLEWRDYLGVPHRGAGIILDQGAEGTLIATAKHNLVDPDEAEPSRDLTVEFRLRPGKRVPAEVVHTFPSHDLGLVRVAGALAPRVLGETAPAGVLNLSAGGEQRVFVVGYGGGVPWSHNVAPVPARFATVAELVIESSEQQAGQSGGGVFDVDWSLMGMVVATEGSVARALPIGLILDEVRHTRYGVGLAPSEEAVRQAARRDLATRHIPWSAASLGDALAAADLEVLGRFLEAGAEVGLIVEGLSRAAPGGISVAQAFFQRTRGDAAAAAWLREAIGAGLDPNTTVPTVAYEETGLVHLAIGTGNAAAALALLEGGASPHAFQALWFTPWPTPRMLFPLDAVVRHQGLSRDEKGALVESLLANGAIVPGLETLSGRMDRTYQTIGLRELPDRARTYAGVELAPNEPSDPGATPVCRFAAERDGFDWCGFAREVPRGIRAAPGEMLHDFWHLDLVGLIHVWDGRAYFMGLEKETHGEAVSLVEVSRDMRVWRVYRFMSPQAGMGHCRAEDGYQPDHCWRRINMTYRPEEGRMMVDDYYSYSVVWERGG